MIQRFLLLIVAAIIGVCMFIAAYWKVILSAFTVIAIFFAVCVYFTKKGLKSHTLKNSETSLHQKSQSEKHELKLDILDNVTHEDTCDSIVPSRKRDREKQCFLKTIAIREGCIYLMPDRYSCSQGAEYKDCFLRKKENLHNDCNTICDIKNKACNLVEWAKNNDCKFFEKTFEQCTLKNGLCIYRGQSSVTHSQTYVATSQFYRPVNVRTYVKKNGTVVYSHGRSRKSR